MAKAPGQGWDPPPLTPHFWRLLRRALRRAGPTTGQKPVSCGASQRPKIACRRRDANVRVEKRRIGKCKSNEREKRRRELGAGGAEGGTRTGAPRTTPTAPLTWDPRRAAFKTRGHRRSQKAPDLRKVPGTETAPSPQAPALAAGGGPQTGISPQNVPGSSEELAVAAGTRDWAPGTLSRWLWNARPPGTAPRPPPPGSAPPPASRGPRGREKPAGERKDPGVSDSPSSLVTHSRRGPGQALLPSRGSPLL